MEIINGGLHYQVGDTITFTNVPFGYGSGASANVTAVAANGRITQVKFVPVGGQITGGTGYDQNFLPNATVNSANGNGASIIVTAILGAGEVITPVMTAAGAITSLAILARGTGYETAPVINLASHGDGTAQANSTIITGSFTYPGRYLNDDGHLSGYNFLQNRDYYQDFSYVVKTHKSMIDYGNSVKELIHPAGMKMFGEYLFVDDDTTNLNVSVSTAGSVYANGTFSGQYTATSNANGTVIKVTTDSASRNVTGLANVYLEFISGDLANLSNGIYTANVINTRSFDTYVANGTPAGTVTANAGNGNTIVLTGSSTNFKNILAIGDRIHISGWSNTFYVGSIANNASLQVTSILPPYITGNTFYKVYNHANSNGTVYFTSI